MDLLFLRTLFHTITGNNGFYPMDTDDFPQDHRSVLGGFCGIHDPKLELHVWVE